MIRNFALAALVGLALAGRAGQAEAQECSVTVEGNDQIQFLQTELRVPASCGEVTVTLKHVGKQPANVMGHNWVLSETAHWRELAMAGVAAGPPDYVPEDERVLAATAVIGGGEETSVTFDISSLEAGGDYTFFCSFPGHYALMNGKFIIE